MTYHSFREQYRVAPDEWPNVKALAGCSSDGVRGMFRVGEGTAIKYLNRECPDGKKKAIDRWIDGGQYLKNLMLVRLPFPGCPAFYTRPDEFDYRAWRAACQRYGMKSLMRF